MTRPDDPGLGGAPPAAAPTDSAGQAWPGKTIPSPGFASDTGQADAGLLAALSAASADSSGVSPRDADAAGRHERRLVELVAAARWLVPIVAVAAEVDDGGEHTVETRSDMAVVTVTAPDGSRGLPMFTSLAALAQWDPRARPVPVRAAAAAQAAVSEGCSVLLVDLASAHATVLRPSMLWAIASQRPWQPAYLDPHVAAAVAAAVDTEPRVSGHRLEAGEPAGAGVLRVVLELPGGLDGDEIGAIATRIGEQIAAAGETRARIDALTFALEAARA